MTHHHRTRQPHSAHGEPRTQQADGHLPTKPHGSHPKSGTATGKEAAAHQAKLPSTAPTMGNRARSKRIVTCPQNPTAATPKKWNRDRQGSGGPPSETAIHHTDHGEPRTQ
jgi:hypothetical protein